MAFFYLQLKLNYSKSPDSGCFTAEHTTHKKATVKCGFLLTEVSKLLTLITLVGARQFGNKAA